MTRTVWVPEATLRPGPIYRRAEDVPGLSPITTDVRLAKHFDSEEACRAWCEGASLSVYQPCEHLLEEA